MTPNTKTSNWRGFAPVDTRRSELSLRSLTIGTFVSLVLTGAEAFLSHAFAEKTNLRNGLGRSEYPAL